MKIPCRQDRGVLRLPAYNSVFSSNFWMTPWKFSGVLAGKKFHGEMPCFHILYRYRLSNSTLYPATIRPHN